MGNTLSPVTTTATGILTNAAANEQLQSLMASAKLSVKDLLPIETAESTRLQGDYQSYIAGTQATINIDNTIKLPENTSIFSVVDANRRVLQGLNSRRDNIINSFVGTDKNFLRAVAVEIRYYLRMTMFVLGPLFAFIIITNFFYKKGFTYKLFYGFWGALWYPLTLLFGVYDPPFWLATIIPLQESKEPVSFLQFWMYNVNTDPNVAAKGSTMLRLVSMGLIALFIFCFFITA